MSSDSGTFRGLCNCELPFRRDQQGAFILGAACPQKPEGTPMADMNSACGACAYKDLDLPALWAQQRQAAAPQPQPVPRPVQTVVPLVSPAPEYGAPAFAPQWTSTLCSVCGEQQFTTPSGDTCKNGHGGAAPVRAAVSGVAYNVPPQQGAVQPQPQPQPAPAPMLPPTKKLISIPAADLVAVEDVDIGAIVDAALEKLREEDKAAGRPVLDTGPSVGGISWHTLEETRCWLRAYRALVLGLRKRRGNTALHYGTLFHECLARHYMSGGNIEETMRPIEAVRLGGAAAFAEEVRAVIRAQLSNPDFVEEESRTWCPRAIEHSAVAFSEPVKINGKTWMIPFSCRHDMLVHIRQPHEPVPGSAPTDNMYVCDWKTTAAMTQDLIKGYLLDGQLMQNCFIFREVEESLFGTLRGFIVTIAAKHKNPGPQSFHRVRDTVNDEQLRMFYKTELLPRAVELIRRLTDEDVRKDVTCWPMNRQECVGKFLCPYFDMCAYGETADYYVDERRILNPAKFAKPPKDYKGTIARPPVEVVTASEERATARKSKTEAKKLMAARIVESLEKVLREQKAFARERFLVAGHTEKTVHAQLIDTCILSFRNSFASSGGVDATLTWPLSAAEGDSVELYLKQRGLAFASDEGRGQIYWKDIATAICKDWWNLSHLTPERAAAELKATPMSAPPAPPALPVPAPAEPAKDETES